MAYRTMTPRAALAAALIAAGCSAAPTTEPPRDATADLDAAEPVDAQPVADARVESDVWLTVRPRNVDLALVERAPATFARVSLPTGVQPAFPWVNREGRGYLSCLDGRFYTVDAYGRATEIERLAGDVAAPTDSPPNAFIELTPGEPTALVPGGALVIRDGTYRHAALPTLLANARAVARWSGESLWATGAGLYTTLGPRWLRLDRAGAPVTDITALVAGPTVGATREAWVLRADHSLHRLRVTARGDGADVVWSDPVPGLDLGAVRTIGALGAHRYIAREADLLRVDERGFVERARVPGMYAGPVALATAGRWLWLAWAGAGDSAIARFDGERVEVLARGLTATSVRLAADGARGDAALVVANGVVHRLVADVSPMVTGFADGVVVTEARLALQVDPPAPAAVTDVTFTLNGARVEQVRTPPYRWGEGGALYRAFPTLAFGSHTVEAVITYDGAPELRVQRTFMYLSPLGRVPTYQGDVAALYEAACARCHSTGIARDLRGYQRMADMAPVVAGVVVSRRMPPDLTLDTPSIQIFSAWVAGGALER